MSASIKPKSCLTGAISASEKIWLVRLGRIVSVFLMIDVFYMVYYTSAHLYSVLVASRKNSPNFTMSSLAGVRTTTFAVLRVIVLVRRKLFRESLWKLVTGKMNPLEDPLSLRKRIKKCLRVFVVCIVFIVAFKVSERVLTVRTTSDPIDIVDFLTFGAVPRIGRYYGRLILIVDNVFGDFLKIDTLGMNLLAFVFIQTLNDRVERFGQKVASNRVVLNKGDVVALGASFRGIEDAVATLDDMFGVIFLCWYMDALLSAFKGIKYFLNGSLGVFGHFYVLFNYFQAPVVVLVLTFAASNIPINLRQARSDLREAISRSSFDHLPMDLYVLLKRMKPDNASLTAAGFFVITRSVCLSFIGFLVTYLIVLISSDRSN